MKNEWMVVCNGTSRACKDFKGPILILGAALFKDKVVRPVTSWLNEHGHRTRVGARWGIGPLHQILTRATYKGLHRFNRKVWKTREAKPEAEQVAVPVDPIIDEATFDSVQSLRNLLRRHDAANG